MNYRRPTSRSQIGATNSTIDPPVDRSAYGDRVKFGGWERKKMISFKELLSVEFRIGLLTPSVSLPQKDARGTRVQMLNSPWKAVCA